MLYRLPTLLIAAALVFAACGDDSADPTTTTRGTVAPATTEPDAPTPDPAQPSGNPDPSRVAGSAWLVTSFGLDGADDPVIPGAVPTIEFGDDGLSIGGTTGCNTYFGTVVYEGEAGVTFTDLGWTEMACMEDGVMMQEQQFVTALALIDRYGLTPDGLVLESSYSDTVIRLVARGAAPDLPLSGDWRLVTFIDGDAATSVLVGSEITLTVDTAAGTLAGNAGCNGFNGGMTAEPSEDLRSAAVVVGPLATTLMACEPDIMDQELLFHEILSAATGMQVEVGFLTVSTDDGRALVFEPAAGD